MASNEPSQWEYRVVEPPREPPQKEARNPTVVLDETAADGWELDETIDYVRDGTKFLVIRRPTTATNAEADYE